MLKVYNTLGRKLEEFRTIDGNKVKFYQCGPTVYWNQHIGNMRAMTIADLIRRSLTFLGYEVTFVRNYTDFGHLTGDNIGDADIGEDRMEKASRRENLTPQIIAEKYIKQFEEDTSKLNVMYPDFAIKATDYISTMKEMIKVLLEKGIAYSTPEAIYFDVSNFPDYTKLSGRILGEEKVGAGHGEVEKTNKKNPSDFALWFFRTGPHKNALQYWESDFSSPEVQNGEGFPGWHIECSAMVKAVLGDTIDIHMGGVEHISIHHTNEIAQSESVTGKKYVNYWLHNEHLLVDGSKMSKSEGTSYLVSDIEEKGFDPIYLRYFFLQSHYRSQQNFTFEALEGAKNAYERLVNLMKDWAKESKLLASFDESNETEINEFRSDLRDFRVNKDFNQIFIQALEDDFNFPKALSVLWDLTKADLQPDDKIATILGFDRVLGLRLEDKLFDSKEVTYPQEALELIELRKKAREEKDYKTSDKIRDELKNKFGIEIRD